MGVIGAWDDFLISSCDHGQCDFTSYLQFSIVCHCSSEFLLLLEKDLAFLRFIN